MNESNYMCETTCNNDIKLLNKNDIIDKKIKLVKKDNTNTEH